MMEALSRLTARTVIVAVPFRLAVSFPVEDTVTTFLLELLYRIRLVAFAGVSFGYSCLVVPFFSVYAARTFRIAVASTPVTVTVTFTETFPDVTVTLQRPGATPRIFPDA
jgi:hypothetical protein